MPEGEMRLDRSFYQQPTIKVSKQLLGKFLVRVEDPPADEAGQESKRVKVGKIVETEAYIGPDDKASHASFGKTKRCKPMYGKAGIAYVYFIYGMYWMLNIVTEEEGRPCAVLVRAVEPRGKKLRNLDIKKLRDLGGGPGKLCQWIKIDGSFNGEDLVKSKRLWIESRLQRAQKKTEGTEIVVAKRIGVDYAGKWAEKPWRFYIKGNPFVSHP